MTQIRTTRPGPGRREAGASSIEYAVLIGVVTAVAIACAILLGSGMQSTFTAFTGKSPTTPGSGSPSGASAEGEGKVQFKDEFDSTSATKKNWDFLGIGWGVKDGALQAGLNGPAGQELRALASQSEGTDYTVALDAQLLAGNGYGVFFRTSGDPKELDGYSFQYDPGYNGGQFIMRKWVNGYEIWPPFAAQSPPAGYNWYAPSRHVELTVQGKTFTASIGGTVVLKGSDSTYSSGGTGLRVWPGGQARFDNFTVTRSASDSHD